MINLLYEQELLSKSNFIAGSDEAGRGCLAGPVVAAIVVINNVNSTVTGVDDSKKISAKKREDLYYKIMRNSSTYSIGVSDVYEIEKYNILNATQIAINRAYDCLKIKPDITLIDGRFSKPFKFINQCILKGDAKHYAIAAASIIAKVYRDSMMSVYSHIYPDYGFIQNKGYGTKLHINAIKQLGYTIIHRKSFNIKSLH